MQQTHECDKTKYVGKNVKFPLNNNNIISDFWKNWKFQNIKENLKILDYEQKSENFYNS